MSEPRASTTEPRSGASLAGIALGALLIALGTGLVLAGRGGRDPYRAGPNGSKPAFTSRARASRSSIPR